MCFSKVVKFMAAMFLIGSAAFASEFTALSVTPQGELSSSVKYPAIQIQFSKPVVALEALGEPSSKSDVFTIEPEIKGVYRWKGTSILSFESAEEIIPQKNYVIKINENLKSKDGTKISGNLSYNFHTEELKLVFVQPAYEDFKNGVYVNTGSVPLDAAKDIGIKFNTNVSLNYVKDFIKVTDSKTGVAFGFSAKQEEKNLIRLTLDKEPLEDTDISVCLKKGAAADSGYYPTSTERVKKFHTLVKFRALSTSSDTSRFASSNGYPVYITFSVPLKEGDEENVVKYITTSLNKKITKENIHIQGQTITVKNLPVQHNDKYTISVSSNLKDIYGRTLDKDYTFNIEVPSLGSYAYFTNSGFKAIESTQNPELKFYHQNIKAGSYYEVTSIGNGNGKTMRFALDPASIEQDKLIEQIVDLKPFLQKSGNEYTGAVKFTSRIYYEYDTVGWKSLNKDIGELDNEQILQITDLGMSVRYSVNNSSNKAIVLVSSLKTGKPLSGVDVNAYYVPESVYNNKNLLARSFKPIAIGKTDKTGVAELEFNARDLSEDNRVLYFEAKTSDDRLIFTSENRYYRPWRDKVVDNIIGDNTIAPISSIDDVKEDTLVERNSMVAFLFSDRKLYKPGESVNIGITDRNLSALGKYSIPKGKEVKYTLTLTDSSWRSTKTYVKKEGSLDSQGVSSESFVLPLDLKPGTYIIHYTRSCDGVSVSYTEDINVQYFERLKFQASTNVGAADSVFIRGDNISATVKSSYLGGGALDGASYSANWKGEGGYFVPKDESLQEYSFSSIENDSRYENYGNITGVLDSEGKANISHDTSSDTWSSRPRVYSVETQVTESGNQAIRTKGSILVHPSRFYIGVKKNNKEKGFTKKGEAVTFDYILITPDEKKPGDRVLPKDKKIRMELIYEEWKNIQTVSNTGVVSSQWKRELVTVKDETLPVSSALGKSASFVVKPENGGSYKVRLSAVDCDGNSVVCEKSFYVTSSDYYRWWNNSEYITLEADKSVYNVGDTAHILMESPVPAGTYLVCVEREKIISQRVITLTSPSSVIDVPIEEDYLPVVYVSVSSYSSRDLSGQTPKGYSGVTALSVSPKARSFDLEIVPDQNTYQPGKKVTVSLRATKDGKPLSNASIILLAVDRGVLDLVDYHVKDALGYFYEQYRFSHNVQGGDSRNLLILQEQETERYRMLYADMVMNKSMVARAAPEAALYESAMDDSDESQDNETQVRKNFAATAFFSSKIITDKKGKASVTFTLPDSLTTYRITAIGVKDNLFANAEKEVDVANPISVRTALPRKLRLNDKGEVGVTLTNLMPKASNADVTLEVFDGIELTGEKQDTSSVIKQAGSASVLGKNNSKVKIQSGKTENAMFSIAANKSGWVTLVFTVKGNDVNEKIIMPLEIEKPYIYERVTTVGSTEDKATETIVLPANAEDGRGSLYIQLDATRLGVLKEAVSYVFHYPYGCMEQRSSAVLPLVAFGDYIKIFGLESEVAYPKGVAEGEIRTWAKNQNPDGGFPYWPGNSESNFYVSCRIAEIAALAKANGIPVGNISTSRLASYIIKEAEKQLSNKESSWSLYAASYAYYAASLLDGNVTSSAIDSIVSSDNADVESIALASLAYINIGEKEKALSASQKLKSFTRLSARGIDITGKGGSHYWCFFNDESEKYALYLQVFTALNPKDSINQHLVYELLKLQRKGNGYWKSTAATSRVLIALDSYIKKNELENLDFSAKTLLGDSVVLEGNFKGVVASAKDCDLDFDSLTLKSVPRGKEQTVNFVKDGKGTLYYTLSMNYAIPVEKQKARDEGICVWTEIVDAETGEKINGNSLVAGKLYRQRLVLSTPTDLEYVALRAAIPCGCEILNDAFVTTISAPEAEKKVSYSPWNYWRNRGLSYKGIYDSEMQYFWNYFPRGSQEIEFVFRAVRKGVYNTPCITAECMYEEEIFGRSDGKLWEIK